MSYIFLLHLCITSMLQGIFVLFKKLIHLNCTPEIQKSVCLERLFQGLNNIYSCTVEEEDPEQFHFLPQSHP